MFICGERCFYSFLCVIASSSNKQNKANLLLFFPGDVASVGVAGRVRSGRRRDVVHRGAHALRVPHRLRRRARKLHDDV